jgi:hypothetical protein
MTDWHLIHLGHLALSGAALLTIEATAVHPSRPPGTIVHVVDQGYMIHERLLRPARVVVTTQRAQTTPMPDDTDLGSEWGSSWVY